MLSMTLFRRIGAPLAALALALILSASARAGGGGLPTGPSASLGDPAVAIDAAGQAVVTFDLACWDEAAAEAIHVELSVALVQGSGPAQATSWGTTVATCVDGTQTVTLVQPSQTAHSYHPGPVYAVVEFFAASSKGGVAGIGDFDLHALPTQAPAR